MHFRLNFFFSVMCIVKNAVARAFFFHYFFFVPLLSVTAVHVRGEQEYVYLATMFQHDYAWQHCICCADAISVNHALLLSGGV